MSERDGNNMTVPDIIVFKGQKSQTGIAFQKEFPGVGFEETDYEFSDIKDIMLGKSLQVALPIWNSHAGEVTVSFALSMIFDEEARLYLLWPDEIKFECLTRKTEDSSKKKLISVSVAEDQCSKFIKVNKYVFSRASSTTKAYEEFKEDDSYEAVLCAPGTNVDQFNILNANAANPINFTTFALLGSLDSRDWGDVEWGQLSNKVCKKNRVFTALQIPFNKTFSDSQEELFDSLIEDAATIADVPKVLFVAKYDLSNCRILIEAGEGFEPSEVLNEDGADEDISLLTDVGRSAEKYSDRIKEFLREYDILESNDFIRHKGTKTCFFACPALGIFTHGFETDVTEFIVLQLIKKCFNLLGRLDPNGTDTAAHALYEKYEKQYQDSGVDFIEFVDVSSN
jgi:hypothetical protein